MLRGVLVNTVLPQNSSSKAGMITGGEQSSLSLSVASLFLLQNFSSKTLTLENSPPNLSNALMTPKAVTSKIESCVLQLHAWKPFDPPFNPKKPCRSDRSTAPNPSHDLDLSKLSLLDDPQKDSYAHTRRWFHRKRRRRGSRSVSGRSSDRSGTHHRASAAYATCSDFPLAAGGTDSSGELFVNGEGSWGSDASETRVLRREIEKESVGGYGFQGSEVVMMTQGNESGYGSEPGYRGDGELGEEDGEIDEEEEDGKLLFWGDRFGGDPDRMEIVGENNFAEQKAHHRCRRKKQHDWRLIAPLR